MSSTTWYVRLGDQIFGPISDDELHARAMRGSVTAQTLVSNDGSNWMEAAGVAGIVFGPNLSPMLPLSPPTASATPQPTGDKAASGVGAGIWVVVAAVVVLILLLGWTTFITTVLWIVVGVATLAAIGFGASALATAKKEDKAGWGIAGICAVIAVVAWYFIPSTAPRPPSTQSTPSSNRETATWNYWQSLRRINQKGSYAAKQLETAKSPEELIVRMQQFAEVCQQMARDINSLPVLNVDQEVTAYASQYVDVMEEAASFFRDVANFLTETKEFINTANSLDKGVEVFIRTLLGDPLGTYNDIKTQGSQLEQRRLALLNRMRAQEERSHNRDATKEISIRSTLSQRYDREFPKLDD